MTPIAPHITAFLRERLTEEHTRATYAYAFRLLFAFASRRLGVASTKPHLVKILRITRLTDVIPLGDSVEAVLAAF